MIKAGISVSFHLEDRNHGRVSQSPWNRSGQLYESHGPEEAHHNHEVCWEAGPSCRGLREREENMKLGGRKWHCNQKIAGSGAHTIHQHECYTDPVPKWSCTRGLSRKKDVIQSFTELFEVRKA